MEVMDLIGLGARILLGVVFIWAGVAKLRTPHWSLLAIEAGTPRIMVMSLPAFESLLGLALVAQLVTEVIPWIAVAVLVAFTTTLTQRYVAGSKAPCNCFGGKSNDPVDKGTIARNVMLLALACIGALTPQ